MQVAVDVDGVISNTIPHMIKEIEKRGYSVTFDRYNPSIPSIENIEEFMYEIVNEVYLKMDQIKPYEDAVEAIPLISKHIGPITFVTARKEHWHAATLKWLQNNFKR